MGQCISRKGEEICLSFHTSPRISFPGSRAMEKGGKEGKEGGRKGGNPVDPSGKSGQTGALGRIPLTLPLQECGAWGESTSAA